jgi:hypothetical protein
MNTPDFSAAPRSSPPTPGCSTGAAFQRLFEDGPAAPVRDAVAAYRNDDGGFGHALEPDRPAPGSQPAAVAMALSMMNETDARDEDLVRGACDWLAAVAPAEGGAAFVEATLAGWAHAPWWVPEEGHPASLVATGMIAGTLSRPRRQPPLARRRHRGHVEQDRQADRAGQLRDVRRARVPSARAGPGPGPRGVRPGRAADPGAEPGGAGPRGARRGARRALFAPEPDSLARALFDDATIQAHLDHLAQGQKDDGGWTFNWPAWSPAAELDWRGFLTVDALRALRANGRR